QYGRAHCPENNIGVVCTGVADIALRHLYGTAHHSDKGSQYVSGIYTLRLKEAGLLASTGSTGGPHDNAMAESINGLYKAEVIHRKSWKNRAEVELVTLTWVDWYNNRCLLVRLGHIPPSEAEKAYYASIGNDELAA
ncbi:integrase core domain-containing protein, partial [Escherichia coli]|uniref:integrase core domain-containing protein n=1 Tax=Escherichia coli TaxID=562 RepID=UPI002034E1FE